MTLTTTQLNKAVVGTTLILRGLYIPKFLQNAIFMLSLFLLGLRLKTRNSAGYYSLLIASQAKKSNRLKHRILKELGYISAEDIVLLCEFLNAHSLITSVDLFNNYISNKGAKTLAGNTTLTTLDVSNNRIGAEGAKALIANYNLQVRAEEYRLPLNTCTGKH